MTVLTPLAIDGSRQGVNRRAKTFWDSDLFSETRIKGRQHCADTSHVLARAGQFQTAVHSAKQHLRLEPGTRAAARRTRLMLCNQQLIRRSFAQDVQPYQYRRDDN